VPTEPLIAKHFPPFITAGATFKVDRSFPSYGNTDWSYALTFAGLYNLTIAGTADPDASDLFHVVLAPSDTAKLNPKGGTALALSFVEVLSALPDGGEVFVAGRGRIMVEPDLTALNDGDAVSLAQRTLNAIRAEILARLTSQASIENYSIGGRSISKIPLRDLVNLRGQYERIVWREENPGRFTVPVDVVFPSNEVAPAPFVRGRWEPT
jgi:hypothetical protein